MQVSIRLPFFQFGKWDMVCGFFNLHFSDDCRTLYLSAIWICSSMNYSALIFYYAVFKFLNQQGGEMTQTMYAHVNK
jgi:hypothetical protein